METRTPHYDPPPADVPAVPTVPGYVVLDLLGRGGMGRVYRARHATLGRVVALKVMAQEPDERSLARFRDEARAVARLQHPCIAALYESGVVEGRPFLVQEFVAGGTLAEALGGRPQEPDWAARVVEAVARAVAYSHDRGVLHRDLKPANILLAPDQTPKVTDFGLAKLLTTDDPSEVDSGPLTRTGEILGTPAYMAPEQASGVVAGIGPAADVYALGAVLYEALTGRPPFQAPDPLQALMMVLTMEPVVPRSLQPKIPRDLETICLKCLEKSPRRRYDGAAALADDLARHRAGEPIVARPVGGFERAWKWSRRRPWQVAALGLVGLGVVALAAGLAWATGKNREINEVNAQLAQTNIGLREANAQLDRSKAQVEGILSYALAALEEYHFGLGAKLKDIPQGEALRVEVLDQASRTLDELDRLAPDRPQVREYLVDGYSRLARVQNQLGQLDRSRRSYERARAVGALLPGDRAGDFRRRANRAALGFELAAILERLGRPQDAVLLLAEGAEMAGDLLRSHGDDVAVLKLNVLASARSAEAALRADDLAGVAAAHGRKAEAFRRLARVDPAEPTHAPAAIEMDLMRTSILIVQGDVPAAERLVESVRSALPPVVVPEPPRTRQLRARLHEAEASIDFARGRLDDVDAAYRRAIALHEGLAADFPASFIHRRSIVLAWTQLGQYWLSARRRDRAAACLDEARTVAAATVAAFPGDAAVAPLRDRVDQIIRELPPPSAP